MASKQSIKCLFLIVCLATPFFLQAQAPSINNIAGAAFSTPTVTYLSPNGAFTIFGSQLAAALTYLSSADIVNDQLPTNLGGTCVESGTNKWYLYYVSPGQINALAGQSLPPYVSGTAPLTVVTNCGTANELSTTMNVTVAQVAPEFLYFVHNSNGQNPVVAVDAATNTYVGTPGLIAGGTFAPAHPGDVLTAYGVGWGDTMPSVPIGTVASGQSTLTNAYYLTVGGMPADVLYIGLSPGSAGLYQVNFTVPSGLAAGNQPLVLTLDAVEIVDTLDYLDIVSTASNAFITVAE
jgi:uncharacterized protein (TIGR03437 family)